MKKRIRSKPHSFEARLAKEAQKLKQQALLLPSGEQRDGLLRRVRQIDMAAHIDEWLRSPGLQPPK